MLTPSSTMRQRCRRSSASTLAKYNSIKRGAALVFAQQQTVRYRTLAKDGFGNVQNAQQ
jgi:hypothetical protein